MRRAIVAIALTISSLYFVLSYKSKPITSLAAAASTPTASPPPRSAPAPVPTATANAVRTVTGPVMWNQYGPVQVAVTLDGTRITDVQAPQLPTDHPRSAYISQTVAPWLKQEVMQAQGANIATISGATFTSISYEQSLQAALNQAGR